MTKFSSFSQRLCDDLSARKKSGWMEEISPLELKLMIFDNVYHQANICHKCSLLLLWIHKSKLPADTLTNTFPFWQPNQLFLLIEFLSEWKWAKFFVVTLQPDNSNNSKKKIQKWNFTATTCFLLPIQPSSRSFILPLSTVALAMGYLTSYLLLDPPAVTVPINLCQGGNRKGILAIAIWLICWLDKIRNKCKCLLLCQQPFPDCLKSAGRLQITLGMRLCSFRSDSWRMCKSCCQRSITMLSVDLLRWEKLCLLALVLLKVTWLAA